MAVDLEKILRPVDYALPPFPAKYGDLNPLAVASPLPLERTSCSRDQRRESRQPTESLPKITRSNVVARDRSGTSRHRPTWDNS